MASPTAISVSVDSNEYSRYEESAKTITVTLAVSGTSFTNEEIRVDLVKARRDRSGVAWSTVLVINGSSPQTATVTFNLPDLVDQDGINLVRFGKYFIRATSNSNPLVVGVSSDFNVRIITVSKFKEDYLFGIRLYSTEIKGVKFPPTNISGISITEVSRTAPNGVGTLSYTYNAAGPVRTISWKNGPATTITGPGTFPLKAGGTGPLAQLGLASVSDYIVVKITSMSALPTSNKTDDLLIEEKVIEDSVIADYIEKTVSWVEEDLLWIRLEPTVYVTDANQAPIAYTAQGFPTAVYTADDYDFIVTPMTYFAPKTGSWVSINTPFLQLLRVDSLYGAIAGTRVIDIDLHWVHFANQGGLIQLMPYNQQVAFSYLSIFFSNAFGRYSELPSFWRGVFVVGIRECTPDIRDLIGKKAAIDLLSMLGAAFKPGIGSYSISRDGVSQSSSLVNAKYGPYSGVITSYKEVLDKEIPRLRAKYRGSAIAVV